MRRLETVDADHGHAAHGELKAGRASHRTEPEDDHVGAPGRPHRAGPPYRLIVTRRPAVSFTTLPPPSRIAPKASAKIPR